MRVVIERPGGGAEEDLELLVSDPEATVADLLVALGEPKDTPGVVLDGRFCHEDLGLEEIGLYEGATLTPGGPPADIERPALAALELRVAGGLDAGRRIALRSGVPLKVGRDPRCDLVLADNGVSREHMEVLAAPSGVVTVTDLDSANGTWVDGRRIREPTPVAPGSLFEAGDVALTVASVPPAVPFDALREARVDGTVPFNRPPRARGPEYGAPLEAPAAPTPPTKPQFSLVTTVGPLLIGAVMVLVLHSILYALFMVLSPVMAVGQYFEQRRRNRRSVDGQGREFQQQVERFETDLEKSRDAELDRLRSTLPDVAALMRRAEMPEPSLWERRRTDRDYLLLSAGFARLAFTPELKQSGMSIAEQAEAALERVHRLPPVPVEVDLAKGGVVGIVGPRAESLAVARNLLCQAATLQGPADLQIAVLTDEAGIDSWEFVKWMPHARDHLGGGSRRLISRGRIGAEELISSLRERREMDPRTLLAVIDGPDLVEGRGAPGRGLLREGPSVSGIILAASTDRLPANCTTVIELSSGTGEARLTRPQRGEQVDPMLIAGLTPETALACARALAKFDDADLELDGASLPTELELLPLLGLEEVSGDALARRWVENARDGALTATVGVDRNGPFSMDFVRDGPHGLIAGTTGSGKSELLRSLVASLAASYSPERLNFVLVDYKGGSAFARCAELPHTVGMVTDLDEQLGSRALTSLEAELHYRERVLRDLGADDIRAADRLVAAGQAKPLPRVLVIIDEFATLANELPDFVSSLVGIAQRGRSLGVHLLLATQRPSGAVNENIRANTNIRISLRVQTSQDSSDVIDDKSAANISRLQPGRAYVRLGPADLDPIQTALVTGPAVAAELAAVQTRPFVLDLETTEATVAAEESSEGREATSLDVLVSAAQDAHADAPLPRRPWLEPLGPDVTLERLLTDLSAGGQERSAVPFAGDRGFTVPIALADDPGAQTQYAAGWNLDAGPLLLVGITGSGTSTALRSIAMSLALTTEPDRLHMYAMDFGAGDLMSLRDLPHVGAVIPVSEHDRQTRLVRTLRREMNDRRENGTAGRPRIVLLVDGYAGFVAEHQDLPGDALREEFARLWADGAEVGIHVAVAGERPNAMPGSMVSVVQQRLILQLADPSDFSQFGIRKAQLPRFVPGRAVLAASPPMVLQIGQPTTEPAALAKVIAEQGPAANPPREIGILPAVLPLTELLSSINGTRPDGAGLWVPLAFDDDQLGPAGWLLYPGEHALITGPSRSGRTTALATIAGLVHALYPGVEIAALAPNPRSNLLNAPGLWGRAAGPAEQADLLERLRTDVDPDRPRLLLVDDSDGIDDSNRKLAELIGDRMSGVHVIAAGRPEAFRALGHWSMGMRGARNGMLLRPDPNMDGAPLGIALPRRPQPPARPGCGYLVIGGLFGVAQLAIPDAALAETT